MNSRELLNMSLEELLEHVESLGPAVTPLENELAQRLRLVVEEQEDHEPWE